MPAEQPFQQCTISVMDNIADPDIRFDGKGICNYYYDFKQAEKDIVITGEEGKRKLQETIDKIKAAGKGKKYDCILGISGGVDSSYLAYIAKQYGLRPLAVHLDNGWNSELAVKNIENLVSKLNLDLHTIVVDWNEFKDIQLSYLKASVIDIEVVTDHAITGTIMRLCKQYGIKYSLTGNNVVTEFVMPKSWIFNKSDHVNLLDIHKRFGTVPIKTYPIFDTYLKKYAHFVLKTESIGLLNYLPFHKDDVKALLAKELGWRDYGGKHYESVFTKFYQAYILPQKFKVDKRKAHLSTLVFSGQMTKEQALKELEQPLYTEAAFKQDYEFVLKKFSLSDEAFKSIMELPVRRHDEFAVESSVYSRYPLLKFIRPVMKFIRP